MKSKDIHIRYEEYQSINELKQNEITLLNAAKMATLNAYAPYSHFTVGAAVSLNNGEIIIGSNQENASYPLSLCAERVAIYHALSQFTRASIDMLAIAACKNHHFTINPVCPCGACLQVMHEAEIRSRKPMRILLYGENKIYTFTSTSKLLPFSFDPDTLNQ